MQLKACLLQWRGVKDELFFLFPITGSFKTSQICEQIRLLSERWLNNKSKVGVSINDALCLN